jgi:DNA-binding CsgD family transcriptional regulator
LVLLAGEPGIGKSRLARELVAIALTQGFAVASGRAPEETGAPVLWLWREVMRSLGNPWEPPAGTEDLRAEDRFRLADEVSSAVLAAAGDGLVIVVDDAHWADRSSVLVLRHLADRLSEVPVLLIVAFRDVGPPSEFRVVLPALVRSLDCERMDLRPLDEASVGLVVRATVSDPDSNLIVAVHRASGGNPFFVDQLARAIAEGSWRPGEDLGSVRDVVRSRLALLGSKCQNLLGVAAVIGDRFEAGLLAESTGTSPESVLALLDEACAHGLVEATGDPGEYKFVHALTQAAVESSLPTSERLQIHRRVAMALESRLGDQPGDQAGIIARHWLALAGAGGDENARRWAWRAAAEAMRRTAYADGVDLYRTALAVPGRVDEGERNRLMVELARACFLSGELAEAAEVARQAGSGARAAGDAAMQAAAALTLEAGNDAAVNAAARQLCDSAIDAIGPNGDRATRARLLALRSHVAFYDLELELAHSLSDDALALARASGDDEALVEALRARQLVSAGPAARPERLALASEMLKVSRRTGSGRIAMWGRLLTIDSLVEQGDLVNAEGQLPALRVAVEQVGGPVSAWLRDRCVACIAQGRGDFATASAAGREAFERMRSIEPVTARAAYLASLCGISHHAGVSEESLTLARMPFEQPPWFVTMGRLGRALLLARAGQLDEAQVDYQLAGPIDRWSFPPFALVVGLAVGAVAAAALHRLDDLELASQRLEPYRGEHVTGESGTVIYLGPVDLHLGVAALVLGRAEHAVTDLKVALDTARRCGTPGFVAEAGYYLALALLARGQTSDRAYAAALARDSGVLIDRLGMGALAEPSAALRRRFQAEETTTGLSSRELEVSALVAEGLSNRQIAQQLVISERTAQNHVQRILTKLGFTSRSQIAAWIIRQQRR